MNIFGYKLIKNSEYEYIKTFFGKRVYVRYFLDNDDSIISDTEIGHLRNSLPFKVEVQVIAQEDK